jgi:hypothetical protein
VNLRTLCCAAAWWLAACGGCAAAGAAGALPPGFDFSDEALFAGALDPQLTGRLLESAFVGVALRAPAHVDIDQRRSLPLLVASRFDGERGWRLPLGERALLVAVEQATGEVKVQSAFGSDKRAAPTRPVPRPSADERRDFGAQLTWVDARARLSLPWKPGCWALRLIYHDWLSNLVHVLLESERQRGAAVCPPLSLARARIEFGLTHGASNGKMRVFGRFTLPVDELGVNRTALVMSVLIVAPGSADIERADLTIPISPDPGAPSISGVIDHEWVGRQRPGSLAYLVVAGRVHGPRTWTQATPSVHP